jgi:hypothetical protein
MREETARTVANVILGTAALGAAVVILRVPTLRRLAFGLLRTAVVTGIPAWITQETRRAWSETSNVDRLRQGYGESAEALRAKAERRTSKEG